jgi:excisionase family DNA binding protein
MMYSVNEAAHVVGRSKATIIRAIASGMLSATRDDPGKPWRIDPAELARAFPEPVHDPVREPDHNASRTALIREKDALIAAHEATIGDLRHRLDQSDAERRQAQQQLAAAHERIAALLTDQRTKTDTVADLPAPPARRSWWRWRRG